MFKRHFKTKKTWLLTILMGLAVVLLCLGAGSGGTSNDPLVTKGWVDKYVQNRATEVSKRLDGIEDAMGGKTKTMVMWINKKEATINTTKTSMDVAPIIKDGRTMLPIKYLADFLVAKVDWDNNTKKVIYTKGSTKLELLVGKKEYRLNGASKTGDAAPIIKDSRTLVPVRLVSDALGAKVEWEPTAKKVTIKY